MNKSESRKFRRYAVYFVPRKETALAKFGRTWFGPDSETENLTKNIEISMDQEHYEHAIAAPRRYGFHATLKAPFMLRTGCDLDDLLAATEDLAYSSSPVALGGLQINPIDEFLALVPVSENRDLDKLALRCVRLLDVYRAPMCKAELKKRRAGGLGEREEKMLLKWGYPYVKKTYRFHMTLTGKLKTREVKIVEQVLAQLGKNTIDRPFMIDDLCVLGDPGNGEPFRLLERFALSGQP